MIKIDPAQIETYRKHLETSQLSPATLSRKLASLNKFTVWADKTGLIRTYPNSPKLLPPSDLERTISRFNLENKKSGFSFLPIVLLLLLLILMPLFLFRIIPGLPVPVQFLSTPASQPTQLVQDNLSPWILYYRGKITNTNSTAPTQTQIKFSLFSKDKGGTPLWASKTWGLEADNNDSFIVPLGDITRGDIQIPSQLFFTQERLYLAMETEGKEFSQRVPVSTAAMAANSYHLQDYPPSLEAGPLSIPVVNQQGTLTLASTSPKIKATADTFSIEGQAITLQTPFASDGSITLAPDGSGTINLRASNSINNSLSITNANLSSGALIGGWIGNDLTTPYLIKLESGATPANKFSVDAQGNTIIAGSLKGSRELTLGDSRTQINLSDPQHTSLPQGTNSILEALSGTGVLTNGGTYLYPSDQQSLRIYDSSGSKYIDVSHDGQNVNITTLGTGQINIDKGIHLAQSLSVVGDASFQGNNTTLGANSNSLINIIGRIVSGLIPNATQTYDLGSSSLYWRNLYAGPLTAINSTGFVGIGTTDPQYQLELSTDSAAKPVSEHWTVPSDARLKDNITAFTDSLDVLKQINPVNYTLNGKAGMPLGAHGIGLIAQDVKNIIPYSVKTFKAKLNPGDENETELYNLDSSALEYVTINAVKELDVKLTSLSDRIFLTDAGGVFARVKTGLIETTNLIAENIVANKIISPLVETDNLMAKVTQTDVIKPLSNDDLIINLSQNSKLKIVNNSEKEVASIDNQGNTSFSGELTALSVSAKNAQFNDASVSGSLTADTGHFRRLFADEISGLNIPTATSSFTLDPSWEASVSALLVQSTTWGTATESANYLTLDAGIATVSDFLAVLGQASITNLSVNNDLYVDNSMHLAKNSINIIGGDSTLYLQPAGVGAVNIMAGKFTIDEFGNVNISGDVYIAGRTTTKDLTVAGEATFSGSLNANNIVIPNNVETPYMASLPNGIATSTGKLHFTNQTGNEIASIDASGSAQFNKLMIAADASPSAISDRFFQDITSNATTGVATLKKNWADLTIYNSMLTPDSLVYITPTSATQNKVLYIKSKTDKYFQVSIDSPIDADISFNWWIIN